MTVATWSIRNPIPAILLFVLLSVAGLSGFRALPIQNLPDVDRPRVNITLTQAGAAPAQLETEVARKVENALATLTGLKHLRTVITEGEVQIAVEFVLEKVLSDALIETKEAVDRVRSDLPAELDPPAVDAVTVGPTMLTYAVDAPRQSEEQLSWFVDDVVSKAVLGIPGVGKFERVGGVDREIRIDVDPVRLSALGVTAADVSRALGAVQQQSSGGHLQLGGAEQAVRTIATVRQARDLDALPIALSDGRHLRLDEIGTVRDTHAERTQAARLDGQPVVAFQIHRTKGFDETRIAAGVDQALARLHMARPDVAFTLVSGSVAHTEEQVQGALDMLYEGALLAVLVVWWFLRDWRATVIAASALPLSILPAFAVMRWLGYSLNTLTLLALAVVVGVLVDDAIVEIENIERHAQMGKSIAQAAADAVSEIALAVIATTMALVAVFLPTAMMGGVAGLYFKQFGWTAVVAVLSSLAVARLVTPMMAVRLLKRFVRPKAADGRVMTGYLGAVRWGLAHRAATLAIAGLVFAASVALVPLLETALVPAPDTGTIEVSVELPPGSALETTVAATEAARAALRGQPGIAHVFATAGAAHDAGGGLSQAGEVRRGNLTVMLTPRGERPRQIDLEAAIGPALRAVPGVRVSLDGGGLGDKMTLILAGDDAEALKSSSDALVHGLRGLPGLSNINSTASLERQEIIVRPDPGRAADLGVTTAAIGSVMRIATRGDFDTALSKLQLDNRQVGIRVRVPDAARRSLATITALRVPGRNGPVPLSSVASLSVGSAPTQIDRYDRRRQITIEADVGGTPLGQALAAAAALPAVRALPSGVALIQAGDAEIMGELTAGFGTALVTGILCVFGVLALLFRDFLQPLTILSAIPLSLGGAFVALLAAHSELDVPSMIGLVLLMGIVTKNSILLVEYAVVGVRDRGLDVDEALVEACHKRARPIVMTTMAMIAGMLPIALGLGADASFRQPMAIAVIGGLVTSTALSLLVVPVVFTVVHALGRRDRAPRSSRMLARDGGEA